MSALINMLCRRLAVRTARTIAAALVFVCVTAVAQPSLRAPLATPSAQPADAQLIPVAGRKDGRSRAPKVSPAQAARRASQKYGGRVLNVVLAQGASGPYYRVKLLDGGSVRVVEIPAR